ncbi:hypothetical protein A9Q89_04630 [Gammaproteobacteria bacterium 53_120_T64]|nr:hypothetical protein A9Q89_04630 [Gammaproteobacteria bacterium 53_120_T64]
MHSRFNRLFLSLFVISFCSCLLAEDIAVVKTRSLPTIERLLTGFQAACTEHNISVYDMEGSAKQGQKILAKIKESHSSSRAQSIFTLGLPATKLFEQSSLSARLFFAMINDPYGKNGLKKAIPGFAQGLPADKLLKQLRVVLPDVERIAIIYSEEVAQAKIDDFITAADDLSLSLNTYFIRSMKDLPDSLLKVIRENDTLLLIPDRNVTNRHSIEFLATTGITRTFPIIGYNEHLVKAGLMASISPDYSALGKMAGGVICHGRDFKGDDQRPQQTALAVNLQAVRMIKPNLSLQLQEIADHVY